MRKYVVATSVGPVVLSADPAVMGARTPVALFIHGAFRSPGVMLPLAQGLPGSVFAFLPGHGAPELAEPTLECWIKGVSEAVALALPRPVMAVGESLGGVVAIGLGGLPAVAIDPFLRTDRLWPVRLMVDPLEGSGQYVGAVSILAPGRDYRAVLDRRAAPLHVLAGDRPLLPPRRADAAPSLLSEEDEALLRRHGGVERVAGGHALVDENPGACRAVIERAMMGLFRVA